MGRVGRLLCWARLELMSLRRQIVSARECRRIRAGYSRLAGPVADLSMVFHFTTGLASKGILLHGFRESRRGWLGPGVYAGTLPNPPSWLKVWLWGLYRRPVRVPIKVISKARFSTIAVVFPPYTVVMRAEEWSGHPLFRGCPKDEVGEIQALSTCS